MILNRVPASLFAAQRPLSIIMSFSKNLAAATFQHILVSRPRPAVTLLTLNRPKALNALSSPLFLELNQALAEADNDKDISAVVLTGSEKAFAGQFVRRAGAEA
jgi:enoyl-CoA hydratase